MHFRQSNIQFQGTCTQTCYYCMLIIIYPFCRFIACTPSHISYFYNYNSYAQPMPRFMFVITCEYWVNIYYYYIPLIYYLDCIQIGVMADNGQVDTPSASSLQYQIVNAHWTCGEGNINSILKEDGGFWRSYIGTDRTKIKCKLKHICRSITVQFRVYNVSMIQLSSYNKQAQVQNQMVFIKSKERQGKDKIVHNFKQSQAQVDQIQLDFQSHNKKQIQIYSLKFYGTIIRTKIPQNNVKPINFQIFQQRQKKKVEQSNKNNKNNKAKKQNNPIIQENKVEHITKTIQIQSKNKLVSIFIPDPYDSEDLMSSQEQQKPSSYKSIQITEQDLQNVMDVSLKWLQAQKKLQNSFGVTVQDRLSVKINPKCFMNVIFCLPNIYGDQKSRYVRMIRQLGGLVREKVEEISQGCIVATSRPQGRQVGIARLKVGVTIVKIHYVDDCYKSKTKLGFQKYLFDPLDFIRA